jgi:sulfur transfer complex TusBCD TusB component (DsrH family)
MCQFCEKETKIKWKTACFLLENIAEEISKDYEKLEELLIFLKERKFYFEGDYIYLKLKRNEYIETCEENSECIFWNSQDIAEEEFIKNVFGFKGLLIKE